jgi:hypothetical protein
LSKNPLEKFRSINLPFDASLVRRLVFKYNNFKRRGFGLLMEEEGKGIPKIQNLVVAHYKDGRLVKGITHDFSPQKKAFHVVSLGGEGEGRGKVSEVFLSELKAVFFVKSLKGRPHHPSPQELSGKQEKSVGSIGVKITFFDGEVLTGATQGYTPEREGFFIVPLDKDTNNLRMFVLSDVIKHLETWK